MAGKKAKIRLWCETPLAAGREVMLNDKQSHYLTNVMKLAVGDAVLAFDNEHGEFLCTLKTAGKRAVGWKFPNRPAALKNVRMFGCCLRR